jgi:tetratricopeptide (TPR) repeat protein
MSLERWDDAVSLLERALRMERASFGPDDPVLTSTLANLALSLTKVGASLRPSPSSASLCRSSRRTKGAENPDIAPDISALGEIYMGEKKFAEAEPVFERLLRIEKKAFGADDPDLATFTTSSSTSTWNWAPLIRPRPRPRPPST